MPGDLGIGIDPSTTATKAIAWDKRGRAIAEGRAAIALSKVTALATGFWAFLMIHVPIVPLAASAGVWLFYVQHRFEKTYWEKSGVWRHDTAA